MTNQPLPSQARRRRPSGRRAGRRGPIFAALDLGTNNCRLLIVEASGPSFRVVDGYSQIVRLGEGLAGAGCLSEAAMTRAIDALRVCAGKLAAWPIAAGRYIATQACRGSSNGAEFLDRVRRETGLDLTVISPREEAELAALGCAPLIDPAAKTALVVDIGGGSTEVSWVAGGAKPGAVLAWISLPFGVVTLADQWGDAIDGAAYDTVVQQVAEALAPFDRAALRTALAEGAAHYVGASGTVTSLAGVWLGLARYQRSKVDGLWMSAAETRATIAALRASSRAARAKNPCIGPDRADLVTPGGAILEAVLNTWGEQPIRVADRGLREGVLAQLMAQTGAARGAG